MSYRRGHRGAMRWAAALLSSGALLLSGRAGAAASLSAQATPPSSGLSVPAAPWPEFLPLGVRAPASPPASLGIAPAPRAAPAAGQPAVPAAPAQPAGELSRQAVSVPALPLPPLAAPAAAATELPGCIGKGLQTILSPACISRLSMVPPRLAASMAGIPLPSLGQPSAQAPDASPFAAPPAFPAARAEPRMAGLECHLTLPMGDMKSFRAASTEACLRGAFGMAGSSSGRFGVVLVDDYGSTVDVSCVASGTGARPLCVIR